MLTRTRKAFTLLELIVVVVVLGILALIAIPTFRTVIDNSAQSAADQTAGAIARNANALAAFAGGGTTGTQVDAAADEATTSSGSTIGDWDTNHLEVTVTRGGSTGCARVVLTGSPAQATVGACP